MAQLQAVQLCNLLKVPQISDFKIHLIVMEAISVLEVTHQAFILKKVMDHKRKLV